jgi:hypothetical protein
MRHALVFWLSTVAFCTAQVTPSGTLEGLWLGTLGSGESSTRLACWFEKTSAGATTGMMSDVASGNASIIGSVVLMGDSIHFEVKGISGMFEGTLLPNRMRIDGVWTQRGVRRPMVLERSQKHSANLPAYQGADVFVPKAPTTVQAGGRDWLYYELHITNWSDLEMTLMHLEILIGDSVVPIGEEGLKKLAIGAGTKLAPWARSVILLAPSGDGFPNSVRHRLTFRLAGEAQPRTVECGATPVERGPIKIAPPLSGAGWQAMNGPDGGSRHHRGVLLAPKGRITIPQRFAFDFTLQHSGSAVGDSLGESGHPSYGAPILAVADGTVVSVLDGVPDNVPDDIFAAIPITLENAFGNRVTLDLGGGSYATYGHLKTGLRVKAGDKVRAGQVLGLIGNSGNSSGPHLHFQVTDGPDPLDSEGIPFVFRSFGQNGKHLSDQMPLDGWVIDFSGRP